MPIHSLVWMWEAFQVGMVAHKGASLNNIKKWLRMNDVVITSVWIHSYSHPLCNQVMKPCFYSNIGLNIWCGVISAFKM